jgi:hypothetical protein
MIKMFKIQCEEGKIVARYNEKEYNIGASILAS